MERMSIHFMRNDSHVADLSVSGRLLSRGNGVTAAKLKIITHQNKKKIITNHITSSTIKQSERTEFLAHHYDHEFYHFQQAKENCGNSNTR